MIICSCNVLSDHAVRDLAQAEEGNLRSPAEVYRCFGCSPECGRCASTIRSILREVSATCAHSEICAAACPLAHAEHAHPANDSDADLAEPVLGKLVAAE